MVVSECKSAIKKNDSFSSFRESAIAGIIAPSRLPKCGLPVLCMPVSILAILSVKFFDKERNNFVIVPNQNHFSYINIEVLS